MSKTISGTILTTYTLSSAQPDVLITGTINAYGPAGSYTINTGSGATLQSFSAAVFGPSTANFTITNTGLIESHGANASNPFDGGILLGASGSVLNAGTIESASGIAAFGTGSSYIENSKLIEGSIGVGVVLFSGSGTVVNSGTIHGEKYGAIALFGGGVISNTSTGLLSSGLAKGDQYAVTGQKNSQPVTVQNAGTITGYTGGIELGSGGFVSNSGDIRAVGTNAAGTGNNYTNFYGGVRLNDGGTVLNSGTISGQNGVYLHYYNQTTHSNTPTPGLAGYVKNSGLIEASTTAGLQLTVSSNGTTSTYGLFGTGIAMEVPGTVVNTGTINASNVGVVIQAQGTNAETMTLVNNGIITGARYAGVGARNGTAIIHNTGVIQQTGSGGGTLSAYAGIYLQQSGQVFNSAGGVISGRSGIHMDGGGYVGNTGSIAANHGVGVYFATSGTAVNSGTITGVHDGVVAGILGGGGYVTNSGLITAGNTVFVSGGNTFGEVGVLLWSNGTLTNETGGTISAAAGVYLYGADTLTNQAGGTIAGVAIGVDGAARFGLSTTIDNAGLIAATGSAFSLNGTVYPATGVVLAGSGIIGNAASGTIAGAGGVGILGANGTLINAGLIEGSAGTAVLLAGASDRLILDAGARFSGAIYDSGSYGVLELAAGSSAGSFDMGGTVSGFGGITFDNGAAWTLEGNYAELGNPNGVAINGFAPGDTLVLDGFTATSDTFAAGMLTLSNGIATETLSLPGVTAGTSFSIVDVAAGTQITEVTCYARGTRIATARGEVAVEELQIGNEVKTLHAGMQKIKWIGMRGYAAPFANHAKVLPICLRAGALGEGVPSRDLYVSPGHAICIDGALVHAARLVNGVSIIQVPCVDEVIYYHIELENHEVIFAENCPAESFMGEYFRPQFHNAASFKALYPQGCAPEHMCLPRLDSGFLFDAIWRRIAARAGINAPVAEGALRGYVDIAGPVVCAGWAQDVAAPERPVCLDIFSQGLRIGRVLANLYREDVRDAGFGSGCHAFEFTLPEGVALPVEVRRSTDGSQLAQTDAAAARAA